MANKAKQFEARARVTDINTSHEAADSVSPDQGRKFLTAIVEFVQASGERGANASEIATGTGISYQNVQRYVKKGKPEIVSSQDRRKGHTGNSMGVWKAFKYVPDHLAVM
jgi:predicted transcriptional regulator